MKKAQLFWMVQTGGWSLLFINTWGKYITNNHLNKTYIILEGALVVALGILYSSLLRIYIKKKVDLNKLTLKTSYKLLLGYGFFSTLLFVSMFLAVPLYWVFHEQLIQFSSILLLSNLINAFVYMLFWLILYISIKTWMRLKHIKVKQLTLLNELKESQLNTLKGQINPHFMFNSLNNIRGLMLEDVEKARDMITRLSEILRFSLSHNYKNSIALSQELEMIENTIALSKIQFEQRLSFKQTVEVDIKNTKIPPMVIQMLIENALKHGISHQQKGGQIQLIIKAKDDVLCISVINPGKLLNDSPSTQLGINNIRKRLHLIYQNRASISLHEKNDSVHANINIPII